MTAADELERMADELLDAIDARDADWKRTGDHFHRGQVDGLSTAYGRLRARADALRSAAPSLPKPDRVEVGQWWQHDGEVTGLSSPRDVRKIHGNRALLPVDGSTSEVAVLCVDLLDDPRWRYLGDGDQPAT
jgi:hypothetical protein